MKQKITDIIADCYINKTLKTVNGLPITRILCTDAKGELPIVGLIEHDGEEMVMQWDEFGNRNPKRLNTSSIYDIAIE